MFAYGFLVGAAVMGCVLLGLFVAFMQWERRRSEPDPMEPWAAQRPYLNAFAQLKREELRAVLEDRCRKDGFAPTNG